MKLNKYIASLLLGSALAGFSSCSDFLEQAPDNRAEIVTPSQVNKLLISGYFDANYALLAEYSSDNVIDNNSPDDKGIYYNLASYDRMDDEVFAFEPVTSNSMDSPALLWESLYKSIATANHALEAIEKMRQKPDLTNSEIASLNASEGEALLIRAYGHFILVNMFSQAYRNDEASNDKVKAQGIPYVTKPETVVYQHYDRGTVTEVYNKIEADLVKGIEKLTAGGRIDTDTPKYHFSKDAAHAFAARFYLFKRKYEKVIEHASAVLGNNPSSLMRNWKAFDGMVTSDAIMNEWANTESPSNLLLIDTYSWYGIRSMGGAYRYQCNRDAAEGTVFGPGPSWTVAPFAVDLISGLQPAGKQDYGYASMSNAWFFEYANKTSGSGYLHQVRREFTAEETLLCRAEAYIYMNNLPMALEDLKTWDTSRQQVPETQKQPFKTLTDALIRDFYKPKNKVVVKVLNTQKMSDDFIVTDEQKPYVDCVLHFRRIQTLFTGLRWFDVKRYGIEYSHAIGKSRVETLTWDDPRRALQVPQEVIASGLEATFRPTMVNTDNSKLIFRTGNDND